MKRIMIVTNALIGGGAERSMNLLANELKRRGKSVSLVPINSGFENQVFPKCEVFPLGRKWRGGPLETIQSMWKFNSLVRKWKPDLVILNCDLPELHGALLLSSQRFIVVEHANFPWISRQILGKVVRKVLNARKTIWVAVSDHLKIWPTNELPSRILLNPIFDTSMSALSRSRQLHSTRKLKRLVFIGRLAPEKRPDWVLEIAMQTKLPIKFIGAGLMHENLEAKAKKGELAVTFAGQVIDPWALVKDGDLLLVPSKYEGDGLVVLEGLFNDVPMLIADIPDFRRFGFPELNYCDSIADFVKTIEFVRLDLSQLSIPTALSEHILFPRSIQSVGDSWTNFFTSI